jgi:hypothetical protein
MSNTTTTPTPNVDDLTYELKSQYDGLSTDLKKYFDTKQDDFLQKTKQTYDNQDNYYKDRGEFLIDRQIDNVDTYRKQVWDYLTTEYNTNTQEKYLNAKTHNQNQTEINRKKKDYDDMSKRYNDLKSTSTTNYRQKEIVLYEYNRRSDQLFIMKITATVLLVCLILTIMVNRLLPYELIYLIILIFVCLIIYIIYYLYFKNLGRSKRYWDKYEFKKPNLGSDTVSSLTDVQITNVDKKMDTDFDKYLDGCSTKTPSPTKRN